MNQKKWTLSEHSSSQRCGAPDFFWRHRALLGRIGQVLHTPSPHQTETWENKKTRIGECGNKTAKCDLKVHGGAFNSLNVTLMPLCDQIGSIFVGILVILSYFVCCLVVSCVCCDEWAPLRNTVGLEGLTTPTTVATAEENIFGITFTAIRSTIETQTANDNPSGLAAWFQEHFPIWYCSRSTLNFGF